MIAFKAFQLCPVDQRPTGIPLAYPWIEESCAEEDAHSFRNEGWTVVTESEYADYVASLEDVLTEYNASKTQLTVEKSIDEAINFGMQCLREFAAENVLLGITVAGMTRTVRTTTADTISALLTGSLYDAIAAAKEIPVESYDSTFVTESRILYFVNKIEAYLGIPLSESL
jgi:hypothetical protein